MRKQCQMCLWEQIRKATNTSKRTVSIQYNLTVLIVPYFFDLPVLNNHHLLSKYTCTEIIQLSAGSS